MHVVDWVVLFFTLIVIAAYGMYKTRKQADLKDYLLDGNRSRWWTIGLSVMATQASAITFLSTPGQAFDDGMRFVQFYFGLPIAMVIICVTFIPIYSRLKVFTAYEFLEGRFDLNTRLLTAGLFLFQRGLAAGITIYAPAIVLSTVLDTNLSDMIWMIGGLVVLYSVSGGTAAVNVTQKYQMLIIFLGLFVAFWVILNSLPSDVGFMDSLRIAGATGKLNLLDFSFDLNDRYTFWTGILGGSFLALSYFGTDQSQVQRYLTGRDIDESRWGLLFNAVFKVPMQFFILLVGIMVFVFYQFNSSPIFFNTSVNEQMYASAVSEEYKAKESELLRLEETKGKLYREYLVGENSTLKAQLNELAVQEKKVRADAKALIADVTPDVETNDRDYVFIHFIVNNMPTGLIGLLLAVFFCAAMSSTASELNALASTTMIDFYKRLFRHDREDTSSVVHARLFTLIWGAIAIAFAQYASLFENLIQFVNIIGSIFYGTILGVFVVGFYLKSIGAKAVFYAAVLTQILIIIVFKQDVVAFLWLNLIGTVLVVGISFLLQTLFRSKD